MCMYVCVYLRVCLSAYACVCLCMFVYVCAHVCIRGFGCTRLCTYICMCVLIVGHVVSDLYMCVYVCVARVLCVCVLCTYVCVCCSPTFASLDDKTNDWCGHCAAFMVFQIVDPLCTFFYQSRLHHLSIYCAAP